MSDSTNVTSLLTEPPGDIAARPRPWLPWSHRLTVARAVLGRLRGRLRLETLGTGLWRGKNISGEEIRIDLKADAVAFEKSRVELHAKVELNIQIPSIRSREPRVFKLGPVHESVATPALPRIDLSTVARELAASFVLSSVHADEVTADVAPIRQVDAGEAQVDGMSAHDIGAPVGELELPGLRLGRVQLQAAALDGGVAARGSAERVALTGRATAADVELRGATISGGSARAAEGDDLNLGFEVQLPALTIKTFPSMPAAIERLVTRLSVTIEPKVVFQIGNVRLDGLSLVTRVGSLRIGELSLPVEVTGARLEDMTWQSAGIEGVELAPSPQAPSEAVESEAANEDRSEE